MSHVPPKKHLRKVRRRLGRLDEMALHDFLRVGDGSQRSLPPKRERREYMELFDLLMRDVDRLLDDLLEDEGQEERDQR